MVIKRKNRKESSIDESEEETIESESKPKLDKDELRIIKGFFNRVNEEGQNHYFHRIRNQKIKMCFHCFLNCVSVAELILSENPFIEGYFDPDQAESILFKLSPFWDYDHCSKFKKRGSCVQKKSK